MSHRHRYLLIVLCAVALASCGDGLTEEERAAQRAAEQALVEARINAVTVDGVEFLAPWREGVPPDGTLYTMRGIEGCGYVRWRRSDSPGEYLVQCAMEHGQWYKQYIVWPNFDRRTAEFRVTASQRE